MEARKLMPLLVIAAGLLAYHNSFTGSYFHDDFGSIPENPTIRRLWPIWQCLSPPHRNWLTVEGRPLINLSLAINYALGGYNVWGYHALNLTVHILAGLTLLGVVRRTLLQPPLRERFGTAANELALATAVLWTVHPLQTESVTYIIQRAESIMGLFYLLTLYCFIRGTESPLVSRSTRDEPRARLWYGLCIGACALGMASKEVMVSAPVMVMLYDRAFLSGSFREVWRRRWPRSVRGWPLYLALAGTWVVLGFVEVSAGIFSYASMTAQHIDRWQYVATQPGVILYYLWLSVWPSPLCLDRPWPLAATWMNILPSTAVVVVLLAASVWAWKRNPAPLRSGPVWGFVGAWFFLILAPSSSFIPLPTPIHEHRMYLSLAAVVSVVVMGLYSVTGRRSLAVFVVVAVGLGFLTWRRNQDYRKNPAYSLGLAFQRAGRIQEAIDYYERALQITPNDADTHYNFGVTLMELGRLQEAIEHYERALRIAPGFAEAHYNLGLALVGLGRAHEAIGHYEQALRMKPDYPEAHNNLAIVLAGLGRLPEAVEHFAEAVRINPGYAEAHNNLGLALARLGRQQEAIAHWEQALRLKPDYAEAHDNLAVALVGLGRLPEAVEHFTEAVRINPGYAEAHYNLGLALSRLGRQQEAMGHWEQALQIKPDFAEAHYNTGIALEQMGRVAEAIGHYEQALRIKPDYTEAQNRLARLRTTR